MATSGSKTVEIYSWISLKFAWSQASQSVDNHTTKINWTLSATTTSAGAVYKKNRTWTVTIDGTKYTGTVNVSLDKSSTQTLASGTATINHNSDGTKTFAYSFSQQFELTLNSGKYMSTYSGSGSDTLTTIPRKSSVSVPDGTLKKSQTITVTRKSANFTHSIKAVCGASTFYIKADGTTSATEVKYDDCSIEWTPHIELASQAPQTQSVLVTFTITTYNGSTVIGTNTDTATYAIPDDIIAPLSYTVTDASGFKDYFGAFVQGKSKPTINMTTYGVYGGWIKSYKVEIGGKTYTTGTQSGTSIVVDTDTINTSGDVDILATVVDSRDRPTSADAKISVLEYEHPKIKSLVAYRSDASGNAKSSGSYFTVKFSSKIYGLNGKNTAAYYVYYKKTSAASYTPAEVTAYSGQYEVTNGTYTFPADDASYDIELRVADVFKTVPQSVTGASINHTVSLLKKNGKIVGMAFNKAAELEGVCDIGFAVKFSGGAYDGDCVVEQGESDGWFYRKWDSGIAECRKIVSVSTAISTAWGTMYVGTTKMSRQNYPLTFVAKPKEVASVTTGANAVWLFAESGGNGVNGAYQTAIYNVCRPTAVSAAATYYITIDVVGKWK